MIEYTIDRQLPNRQLRDGRSGGWGPQPPETANLLEVVGCADIRRAFDRHAGSAAKTDSRGRRATRNIIQAAAVIGAELVIPVAVADISFPHLALSYRLAGRASRPDGRIDRPRCPRIAGATVYATLAVITRRLTTCSSLRGDRRCTRENGLIATPFRSNSDARRDSNRRLEGNNSVTRPWIIAAAVAAVLASAAFAQERSQGAATIPDFSGIWGNPYLYGIEPPASGPGPVVNKARRRQTLDADGRPFATAADAPLVSLAIRLVGDIPIRS